jgi:tripeptide aminopeptidase
MRNIIKTFIEMSEILSPSRNEKDLADYIIKKVEKISDDIIVDSSYKQTKSNTGNIIIKIAGNKKLKPLMLSAHLDTVEIDKKPDIKIEKNIIRTANNVILGADCKAGIAIIIDVINEIIDKKINHPPLELVFTTCEEIGLLGTRYIDKKYLKAKEGIVLDNEKEINHPVIKAVGVDNFDILVRGRAAHAGVDIEKGVSAIKLISKIINEIETGRLSKDTTLNIGFVEGGSGINTVPEMASASGEVRSFNINEIIERENEIKKIVKKASGNKEFKEADVRLEIKKRFDAFEILEDDELIKKIGGAYKKNGIRPEFVKSFGGTDANNFYTIGIKTVNIPTGMRDVHTSKEYLKIDEFLMARKITLDIIKEIAE